MVKMDEGMKQTGAEVRELLYHVPFYIAFILIHANRFLQKYRNKR